MSRFNSRKENLVVSYGYDPIPMGGYFFQVFDVKLPEDKQLIINEGFIEGISKSRMLELMEKYDVGTEEQRMSVALDLPI